MLSRLAVLLAVVSGAGLAVESLVVEPRHPLVRRGLPVTAVIQWQGLPQPGPATLVAEIADGAGILARVTLTLTSGDQVAWPSRISVIPERVSGPAPRLRVRLERDGAVIGHTETPLIAPVDLVAPPPSGLVSRLMADLVQGGEDMTVGDLERFQRGFPGWQSLTDPVDGSLQPVRLHLVPGSTRGVVLLHTPPRDEGGSGAWWPELPPAWRAAAVAAGVSMVEVFPGGDVAWTGPGPRRVPGAAALLPPGERVVLAVGSVPASAAGALPVWTADPAALADPATWRRSAQPAPPAQPVPPLMAWAGGPVTVVVGTGEHLASAQDNAARAEALNEAWWRWSRGVLPVLRDDQPLPPTGNLVLLGSPRSNRHLAALVPNSPAVTWSDRIITVKGRELLRPLQPSVAWAFPRPGVSGAWVLVLDGPWRWGDLPLPAGDLEIRE